MKRKPRQRARRGRPEAREAAPARPDSSLQRFLPGLVILAGLVAYYNSFVGAFVFDDRVHIVENVWIRKLWPIWDVLANVRRPVVNISLALNYAISELDVWSYHAFNLGVHILAGLILFGVIRRTMLREGLRERYGAGALWLALTSAVIWVVHPLQTQSVMYIIQRCESLMGMFYLLTLYCIIRGAGSPRARAWYACAIVSCALGMGSKAVMVTAPVVMLLYDRVFLARSFADLFRRRWGLHLGLVATWGVLGAAGVVRGVLTTAPAAVANVGFAVRGVSPAEYAMTQPGVMMHYLRLSLWAHPLCLDHAWPVARTATSILIPGTVIVILLAATVWSLIRRPALGFLGAWFFIILSPTSSFIPIKDMLFEHRMYLPLAAVVVGVVVGGHEILTLLARRGGWGTRARRVVSVAAVLVVVAALCLTTIRRNTVYESDFSIWSDVVAKNPENMRAHFALGNELIRQGEVEAGLEKYLLVLRADPEDLQARSNLAETLHQSGKLDEAIEQYQTVLLMQPMLSAVRVNLGVALVDSGRIEEGAAELKTALNSLNSSRLPQLASLGHYTRGNALASLGRMDEGIEEFRQALFVDPMHLQSRIGLAEALYRVGRLGEAVEQFQALLRMEPRMAPARVSLGIALVDMGRIDEGAAEVNSALQAFAADRRADLAALAHFRLGDALMRQNRLDEAVAEFRRVLEIIPDHPHAQEALDAALARKAQSNQE